MKKDIEPKCIVCGELSGLQMLCGRCSEEQRSKGFKRIAEIVSDYEERQAMMLKRNRRENWLLTLATAILVAGGFWLYFYVLLWLDNGRSVIR